MNTPQKCAMCDSLHFDASRINDPNYVAECEIGFVLGECNFCCSEFESQFMEKNIFRGYEEGTFCMYGKPEFAHDGEVDGITYYDNMTDEITLYYCPFCGVKL